MRSNSVYCSKKTCGDERPGEPRTGRSSDTSPALYLCCCVNFSAFRFASSSAELFTSRAPSRSRTFSCHKEQRLDQYTTTLAYSRTPPCRARLSGTPRYLEQNRISLGFALVLSVIYYGLSRTRLSRTPHHLELFLAPLSSYRLKTHWSTSGCESWECVYGNEDKVRYWLALLLRIQKVTSCRCSSILHFYCTYPSS